MGIAPSKASASSAFKPKKCDDDTTVSSDITLKMSELVSYCHIVSTAELPLFFSVLSASKTLRAAKGKNNATSASPFASRNLGFQIQTAKSSPLRPPRQYLTTTKTTQDLKQKQQKKKKTMGNTIRCKSRNNSAYSDVDFDGLKTSVDDLKTSVDDLKTSVNDLKTSVNDLKTTCKFVRRRNWRWVSSVSSPLTNDPLNVSTLRLLSNISCVKVGSLLQRVEALEKSFAKIPTETRNHAARNKSISSLSSSSDKGGKDITLLLVSRKSPDSDKGIQEGIEVEL